MRLRSILTALLLLLVEAPSPAAETLWDRLQVHGFASQAGVKTSANRFFGDSNDGSLDFTEIGVNASYRFDPKLMVAGQILARRAGDMYDGTPSLDYLLADVTLLSSNERQLGFRVGRNKNQLGLYNETRDVPFTRPGIFLPQTVYFDKVRNLALSSDGLVVYGESYGERGNFSLTLGGGRALVDDNVEWNFLGDDFDGTMEPDGLSWVGSLWYTTLDEQLKFGLSSAWSAMRFKPGTPFPIEDGTTTFNISIASFQYNTERITLSAEYAYQPISWRDYGPFFPLSSATATGAYVQGAYRIRPNIEVMLRFEEGFNNNADPTGVEGSALTGRPPYDFYSRIWATGLRWDITPNWMVRAEYQQHRGTFSLSLRENTSIDDLRERWDLFALQLSFRF
jgi:hypothetical protein